MRVVVIRVLTLFAVLTIGVSANASAQCAAFGANPNDWIPDDQALNDCFAANSNVYLDRGNPGYMVASGLILRSNQRLVTTSGPDKAILIAGPNLIVAMLQVLDGSDYELSELIFDGRKSVRNRTDQCFVNRNGLNLDLSGSNYRVHHLDVVNAMCLSGAFARGNNFEIYSVLFADNGYPANQVAQQWANGMHVTRCSDGYIHNNSFVDNSDVGLAIVAGYNCQVLWNEITNYNVEGFAGLHVGDTPDGSQDLTGAVVAYNTVNSGYNKLPFGLVVGPHPWNASFTYANVGEVRNNTIAGAVVNLAIDGIDSGYISDNATSGHQGDRGFNCPGFSAEATAIHFGSATINQPYISKHYHGGGCGS